MRAMKLHYDLFHFLKRYLFCRLCRSYCRLLSFMSYCHSLLFAAVRIAVFYRF